MGRRAVLLRLLPRLITLFPPLHFPTPPHPCHNRLMRQSRFAAAVPEHFRLAGMGLANRLQPPPGREEVSPLGKSQLPQLLRSRLVGQRRRVAAEGSAFSFPWKPKLPKLPFMFARARRAPEQCTGREATRTASRRVSGAEPAARRARAHGIERTCAAMASANIGTIRRSEAQRRLRTEGSSAFSCDSRNPGRRRNWAPACAGEQSTACSARGGIGFAEDRHTNGMCKVGKLCPPELTPSARCLGELHVHP